ncbi:PAS domain S-box protein [Frigoriglobus tundricola]|uniref:histidine kinase n=1 Tax=Frigoriglobus tundricola TaxID=2774151 RepID=A0A6M5YI74_9BACT|nr:PAS domain S-box protein [Frigoriglobus tundricola]QJW92966.1 hypothetical protein FTUN_0464 [Frigoriglobus tundricola]
MPDAPIRLVIVEDNPSDAKLLDHALRRGGVEFRSVRVDSEADYVAALADEPDVVLCDWQMPHFNSLRALELLRNRRPHTPFILVSGSIGEEAAVHIIKLGATDYLLKDRLGRLGPAVRQALEQSALRTAAQQSAEALRRSEAALAEAQRVAHLGSWVWDPPTGAVLWSDAIYELFGLDRATTRPSLETFLSVLHPDDRPAALARVETMLAGADEFANDFRIVRPDGAVLWIHSRARATRDPAGALLRVDGIDQDITDRKRTEAALRASEERYRLAIRATNDAVWDLDLLSECVHQSDPFTALFSYTPNTASRLQSWIDRVHPEDRERAWEGLQGAIGGAESHWECDYRFLRTDGVWAEVHDRGFILRDEDGRAQRIVGAMQDVTDRKRAEAELWKTAELLRAVANGTTDAVYVKDRNGKYLLLNAAAAGFVGKTVAEVLGRDDSGLFDPEGARRAMAWDRRVMESGCAETDEETLTAAGVSRTFLTTKAPYRDANGTVTGVIGISRDVTEWKRAADAVRESEERYRRLVEVLPDAVFINAGGRIVFCNPACLRLLGATDPAQVIGKDPLELFHPDYHAAIRGRIGRMIETRESAPALEERVVRLDGRAVTVLVIATPIPARGADAILVVLTDLTERERSLERLRSVMGSVSDAILTTDGHGTVGSVNTGTQRVFGYTEAELVGASVWLLVPGSGPGERDGPLANGPRPGVPRLVGGGREVVGRRKDGSTFPLELTVTEFHLDGDRHFTWVLHDITARKQLEEQYRHAQKMEAVGQLAGGVAHDFNNLLTVINGCSEMLLEDAGDGPSVRTRAGAIREAGERAAGLTSQLLAFSRRTVLEPRIVCPNVVVAETGNLLARLIGEDVRLVTALDPRIGRVRVDPGQFGQVLMNLAVNARDAMPTGGRLTIETRDVVLDEAHTRVRSEVRPGRYAVITVADTGTGMTAEVKARVFEPFFTTKGPGKGTGLGLATVFGIVKQSSGHIEVDSAVGAGTTFRIFLPVIDEGTVPVPTAKPVRVCGGTETVLLVEDQAEVRRVALIALQARGYHVTEAVDAQDALRLVERDRPRLDILVTDVVMPGMSGRELAEAIRGRYPLIKVLYMSGFTEDTVVRHGVLQADTAFLHKPFTPYSLTKKVREVLDHA